MQLSPHFSLEELTASDTAVRQNIDNTPSAEVIKNLTRLAEFLEKVRALINAPISISSGYRSQALNAFLASGSNAHKVASKSQHCLGCAADFKVRGMTPDLVVRLLKDSGLKYDQLIREFDSWVHISIPNIEGSPPRGQVLIIDKTGTRNFS